MESFWENGKQVLECYVCNVDKLDFHELNCCDKIICE